MTPEQWGQLLPPLISAVGAIGAFATAAAAFLESRKTTSVAQQGVAAATEAADAARATQQATVDRLDYDRLRRMEAALLTLDECEPCRAKILAVTDRRRLRPLETDE